MFVGIDQSHLYSNKPNMNSMATMLHVYLGNNLMLLSV